MTTNGTPNKAAVEALEKLLESTDEPIALQAAQTLLDYEIKKASLSKV